MPPTRKPWPMKWIVLAIVIALPLYTYLTLRYRKPGPEYQPYEDEQQRAGLARAGYQRIAVRAEWPSDPKPLPADVAIAAAAGGLPANLRATLLTAPLLPRAIGPVEAAPVASHATAYRVEFFSTQSDNHQELSDVTLYYKGSDVYLVPNCERLSGELIARAHAAVTLLTLPPGCLPAGTYRVTLVGELAAKVWTLQVR